MTKSVLYKTTTDSRTYNIIRLHGKEVECCVRCERRRSNSFYCLVDKKNTKWFRKESKFPSWKLASRNKHQWGIKKLKLTPFHELRGISMNVSRHHCKISW